MADNKYSTSDGNRDDASEDLFNQEATARITPNRKISDDLREHVQLQEEELFKQNIQGRIDHQIKGDVLPEIKSEGFAFVESSSLMSEIRSDGVLPAGTEIANLSMPAEGGDFAFSLENNRFEILGDRLLLKIDTTPEAAQDFSFEIQVSSNTSSFVIDVPVQVGFDQLVRALNSESEYINQVPTGISLTNDNIDENSEAGTVVANLVATDNDNDSGFSFELSGEGSESFEIIGSQLVVKAGTQLDFEQQPQHAVEISATDSAGNTYTETVTVNLNDINEAPVFTDSGFRIHEGQELHRGELTADDPDFSEQLTFTVAEGVQLPPGFALSADGNYSFDPSDPAYDHLAEGSSQIISVPVTVMDSGGLKDSAQIQITVTGTNDGPVADVDVIASITEGEAVLQGKLTATDAGDGSSLNFSADMPLPAGFTLDAEGNYSFDPTDSAYEHLGANDSTTLTVPVTVTDERGATDSQQIRITVQGTNDAPVAGSDVTADVSEGDAIIDGQLSASDVDDAASLSFSVKEGADTPAGFTLESDGSYSFDPTEAAYDSMDLGDSKVLNIPVTVSDGLGGSDTQQIQITVTGTNAAPVAGADVTASVDEGDVAISGQLSASDADDAVNLTFAITDGASAPAGFSLNEDGSYSFDPQDAAYDSMDAGDSQTLTIPVTVSDGLGGSDTQQIQITLTGTNDAPSSIVTVGGVVDESSSGGTVVATLSATDADEGDTFSYSLTDDQSGLFEIVGNEVRVRDGAKVDFETAQSHEVTIEVTDSEGASFSRPVTLTVNDINEEPTDISLSGGSVDENSAAGVVVATLSATDEDTGDTFSYNLSDDQSGLFEIVGNEIRVKEGADIDFESAESHDVTVQVTDSAGSTYSESHTLTVNDSDEAEAPTLTVDLGDAEFVAATQQVVSDIFIDNASFEERDLAEGGIGWNQAAGWSSTGIGQLGTFNQLEDNSFSGQALDGENVSYLNQGAILSQTLGETLSEGAVYTLQADMLNRTDGGFGLNYEIKLYAGESLVATVDQDAVPMVDDQLVTTSLQLDTATLAENFADYGQPLRIEVSNPGPGQISVDNLRMSATTIERVPEGDVIEYPLDISAGVTDADGSDSISGIVVSGLPEGVQLSAGEENGDGSWILAPEEGAGLTLTVPNGVDDFELSVAATAQDINDGDTTTTTEVIAVAVDNEASAPTLNVTVGGGELVPDVQTTALEVSNASFEDNETADGSHYYGAVSGWERTPGAANIYNPDEQNSFAAGVDGENAAIIYGANGEASLSQTLSETLTEGASYELSVDVGGANPTIRLYAGDSLVGELETSREMLVSGRMTNVTLKVDAAELAADFSDYDQPLRIELYGSEGVGSFRYFDNVQLTEAVTLADSKLVEYPLDISAAVTDTDGSESIADYVIAGLADGAVLTAGEQSDDGSWSVQPGQLEGLAIRAPVAAEDFTLSVSATATEANGGQTTVTSVSIEVENVAVAPLGTGIDYSSYGVENTDTSGMNAIIGDSGNEKLHGTDSDDYIAAGNGNDKAYGYDGDDVLDGGEGNDHLYAGDGNDTLYGGAGNDQLQGDEGRDYLAGGEGNDKLEGGAENDQLIGGEGNDALSGGSGDDLLSGGIGNDTASGSDGNDTYIFNPFDGNDSFSGGTGGGWTDVIQLSTDGSNDPDNPWAITVDGQELEYDAAAQALELNPDTSGVVTMADGSELTFEGVEKIEW